MKRQNRENAKQTRKRRHIYDAYLTCLLNDLSILLALEIEQLEVRKNQCSLLKRKRNVSAGPFLGILGVIPPDLLLSTALNYFQLRVSMSSRSECWSNICVNDIQQSIMPCPMYIYLNGKGDLRSVYKSQSVNEVIENIGYRSKVLHKVTKSIHGWNPSSLFLMICFRCR